MDEDPTRAHEPDGRSPNGNSALSTESGPADSSPRTEGIVDSASSVGASNSGSSNGGSSNGGSSNGGSSKPAATRRFRRVARVATPIVLVLGIVAMLAPSAPASWALSRAIARSVSDCVDISGLDLDLGSWPVIPRAGLGRISNLSATADAVDLNGLRLSDVSFSVDQLDYSPLQWIGRDGPVTIENGRTSAHITEADLNAYMGKDLPGLNVDLNSDHLTLRVAIPLIGSIDVPLRLTLDQGGLLLMPDLEDTMPTIGRLLPGLRVDPPAGMEMTGLKISDGSIAMEATFNIDGRLEPIACDAAGGVKLSRG